MVGTRAQRSHQYEMERTRLEAATLEDLRQEALRCQLPVLASSDRESLIEAILANSEQNVPLEEMPPPQRSRTQSERSHKGSAQAETPGSSQVMAPTAETSGALDRFTQTLGIFIEQQRQMMDEIRILTRRESLVREEIPHERETERYEITRSPAISTSSPAQAVTLLAPQIPEFGGTDDENVQIWTQRVDRVAQVHRASDDVVLLAASGKLVKLAKQWYEMQNGGVLESWAALKLALTQMFDRRVSFTASMQKIEARKWSPSKESFDQYSMDKLALIHRLNLPAADTINLIIGGIPQHSLRATALTLPTTSLDQFLEAMRRITVGLGDFDKKSPNQNNKNNRSKDSNSKDIKRQGDGKATETTCNYCKKRGHWKADCQLLKKKEKASPSASSPASARASTSSTQPTAAAVAESESTESAKFRITSPLIEIVNFNNNSCRLNALMDTGSPVSFISQNNLNKLLVSAPSLEPVGRRFNALPKTPIDVLGKLNVSISLKEFPDRNFDVALHVVNSDFADIDVIIGREFLENYNLTLIFRPSKIESKSFAQILLETDVCYTNVTTESIIDDCEIDFGWEAKKQLKAIVNDCISAQVSVVEDNYEVAVHLKDPTPYAYAPRKFALKEREQIREITDDLLARGIIKNSTSPYCARIVPVRKKNGNLRLCVDLRPLNARVIKQKYPFPLIKDCLSRLSDKMVFTLLDLKDGFHQIKVHPDCTKYFAFATPDGQFEYLRLPFGFSESPAEFQKRIVQILQPLIRANKILVYIDDILIASNSVVENLSVLKEILLTLRKYGFELNFAKCCFLKKKIEFLGYIISHNQLTMSDRHTEAVKNFPTPKNVHQVQRFLGLTNYFRKFVQNYANIARPLHNLLKKSTEFRFDDDCIRAFESLKNALITHPVLRLYNPTAHTELHTDASSHGLGAILLQKQVDAKWAPVAFFSQATNQAEAKYHSFELEMLAIVRSIERFHIYLYGISFTVVTDCNALVYAVNKANLNPRIARWTLLLQNYDFKVEHRPGKRMAHVDALSRQVSYLEILPLERELELRQLQDTRLKQIALDLEYGTESNEFRLIEGLVYKKGVDRDRFVIPDSMINNLIRIHHDDMAHCGVEKTFEGLNRSYWFPAMRKRIRDYIDNCIICLYANSSTNRFEGGSQIEDTPPATPFEIIHIDHFGPLQETKNGFKYVLVTVDAFTRYTWLFATKTTSSREVCKNLKFLFNIFGTPSTIISDRGTAFTSSEFSDFLKNLNIKLIKVAVASPWANGMVERINRFLKSSLSKVIESPSDWERKLADIQYVINNTHHTAIKTTPSKLLLGYDQTGHSDKNLKGLVDSLSKINTDIIEQRDEARDTALQTNKKLREYNREYYNLRHKKPTQYKEGDLVLIRDLQTKTGSSSKLKPNYKGPYMVAKTLNKNRYVIKDIPGFNVTQKPYNSIMSPDKLKLWIKPVTEPKE